MTITEKLGARIPDKMGRRIWNIAVFVLACAGIYVHLWAGGTDGHEITLRPVGHGTVFVALVWAIVSSRRRSPSRARVVAPDS